MRLKWSPLAIYRTTETVEEQLRAITEPIEQARITLANALATPKLPQYMTWALKSLSNELDCTTHRLNGKISSVRTQLPKTDLAKEQHRAFLLRQLGLPE